MFIILYDVIIKLHKEIRESSLWNMRPCGAKNYVYSDEDDGRPAEESFSVGTSIIAKVFFERAKLENHWSDNKNYCFHQIAHLSRDVKWLRKKNYIYTICRLV